MAYYQPPRVIWDAPGFTQGVKIERLMEDGNWYAWYVPHNGIVPHAMAADILEVTVMTIHNWVTAGKIGALKWQGTPSMIPLREIKKMRKTLERERKQREGL